MPVSPKRKKDGKPVRRAQPAVAPEAAAGTSAAPEAAVQPQAERHAGKPRNPFVAQHGHKASQRGR